MDFAIPDDLPIEDSNVKIDSSRAKESPLPASGFPQVTTQQAKDFVDRNSLVPLLNELMADVILAEAEDPIDHMTRWFLRHTPVTAAERAEHGDEESEAQLGEITEQRNAAVAAKHDDAVRYCQRFKLPELIDELLTAMIVENPDDQGRFAMSWLRWHKKKFVARHRPAGYKEYLEKLEADPDRGVPASP